MNGIRLNGSAETVRTRRLQAGEENRLIAAAAPHLRALIIATLSTGCRLGKLLDLQLGDVHVDERECYRWFVLQGTKTKTRETRVVPIGQTLGAVLEMLRYDPAGRKLEPRTYVRYRSGRPRRFREDGVAVCVREGRDRRSALSRLEFACRLLESRAEFHDVRDFLGHANITTTSRYLRRRRCGSSERYDRWWKPSPVPVPHHCHTARNSCVTPRSMIQTSVTNSRRISKLP